MTSNQAITELPNHAENPYAPPTAQVKDINLPDDSTNKESFYVVSPIKFWVLFIGTLNLYGYYWMYKHWANWRRMRRAEIWPVPRSIFQIFYLHSLAREINLELERKNIAYAWLGNLWATLAVVELLFSGVLSQITDDYSPLWVQIWPIFSIPAAAYFAWNIQKAANAACSDPDGSSNANFTAANIAWCVISGFLWVIVLLGIAVVWLEL